MISEKSSAVPNSTALCSVQFLQPQLIYYNTYNNKMSVKNVRTYIIAAHMTKIFKHRDNNIHLI